MARRSRASGGVPRLGKQPPRYRFFLNPYTDARFTTCPQCGEKTRVRKLPLVIHIDPMQLVALNKTCRYCPRCDLLIAHQDELEAWLAWAPRTAPRGGAVRTRPSRSRRCSSTSMTSSRSFGSSRPRPGGGPDAKQLVHPSEDEPRC